MAKTGPKGPWKYRKNFHPKDFIRLSRKGKNIYQIANIWNVNQDTIHTWGHEHPQFSEAVKTGKEYCEAWYTDIGQAAMLGKLKIDGENITLNLRAYEILTRNILKWSSNRIEKEVESTIVSTTVYKAQLEIDDQT